MAARRYPEKILKRKLDRTVKMMERKDKIIRTLGAIEHPENFTKEELDALLSDGVCPYLSRFIG